MADKVKYGVQKVHYALKTTSGYSTPVAMPGAVSLALAPNVDLEVAYVPETFLKDVLGMTEDASAKTLYETASTQPKPFALLFEEEGDDTGTKFVLYNCVANRPSRSLATKEDAINPQTQSLTIAASPLASGETMAMTKSDTTTTVMNGWYSSVWMHT